MRMLVATPVTTFPIVANDLTCRRRTDTLIVGLTGNASLTSLSTALAAVPTCTDPIRIPPPDAITRLNHDLAPELGLGPSRLHRRRWN